MGLILRHFHYWNAGVMCWVDNYFLLPEYRNGNGARMLGFFRQRLKHMGVIKWHLSCKAHRDHSALFRAMGLKLSDHVFTQLL